MTQDAASLDTLYSKWGNSLYQEEENFNCFEWISNSFVFGKKQLVVADRVQALLSTSSDYQTT
jgi:hypothetical protein